MATGRHVRIWVSRTVAIGVCCEAKVNTDTATFERRDIEPSVLHCIKCHLQQKALLRVHVTGFIRWNAKKTVIEQVDPIHVPRQQMRCRTPWKAIKPALRRLTDGIVAGVQQVPIGLK